MILVLQGKLVLLLGVVAIDGVSHTKVEGNQMWVGNIEDIVMLWIPGNLIFYGYPGIDNQLS